MRKNECKDIGIDPLDKSVGPNSGAPPNSSADKTFIEILSQNASVNSFKELMTYELPSPFSKSKVAAPRCLRSSWSNRHHPRGNQGRRW